MVIKCTNQKEFYNVLKKIENNTDILWSDNTKPTMFSFTISKYPVWLISYRNNRMTFSCNYDLVPFDILELTAQEYLSME